MAVSRRVQIGIVEIPVLEMSEAKAARESGAHFLVYLSLVQRETVEHMLEFWGQKGMRLYPYPS